MSESGLFLPGPGDPQKHGLVSAAGSVICCLVVACVFGTLRSSPDSFPRDEAASVGVNVLQVVSRKLIVCVRVPK